MSKIISNTSLADFQRKSLFSLENREQSIISKIAKTGKELSRIYEEFLIEKHDYINHKKTIEYLFNKPLKKVLSYYDLMTVNYDSSIKLIRLELKEKDKINGHVFLMNEFLSKYSNEYESYGKYLKIYEQQYKKSFNELLKFNYLPAKSELNIHEKNIVQILNRIGDVSNNKEFNFVYKWNFKVEGEHTHLMKLPTVNYQQLFVYDFYGIVIRHSQLVHFVILFDDDCHFDSSPFCEQKVFKDFENIHRNDILKQFMLCQMNIHLLRLNKRSNLKTEILSFVKRIRSSTEYVIEGKIKPIARLFQSKEIVEELALFREDYKYNHLIYSKIPLKKNPKYDSSDDEYFECQSIKDNYSKVAVDSGVMVSCDVLKNIIKDKKDFHPLKKKTANEERANEIIVELKRDNGVESSNHEVSDDNELDEKEEAEILNIVFS
jgi:hypothetical protein